MTYYLRTALLLEEKAAKLPRDSVRRADLLTLAKAARLIDMELHAWDHEIQQRIGSFRKRAHAWARLAKQMSPGPEKAELQCMAERAAIHGALSGLM